MEHILKKYMSQFTALDPEQQQAVIADIAIEKHPKGAVLLRQGDVPTKCYFVLQGCVRQVAVDEKGREITSNFYTEEQAIPMFHRHEADASSPYSFVCLEDSVLVAGDFEAEKDMYAKYGELESMTRRMVELRFGEMQEEFAAFIASTPEERYKALLRKRPGLVDRVPQHQLASYLGMTPESLSRIKKRIGTR